MTFRRVLSLLCLAACASALVGCAGGDALALDPVAQAADTTSKTTSSRFEFRASIDAGSVGSFAFHGNGVFDGKDKSGWMNMHFTLPPAYQLQVPTSDPSMEMIFDGSHGLVMYMRSPLFDKVVPTGKWVKMDLAKMAKNGQDLNAILNANQADPSQSLRMLMASSGELGTPVTMTITEDLYDFGTPVNITPPTGDLVVDLSSLSGSSS